MFYTVLNKALRAVARLVFFYKSEEEMRQVQRRIRGREELRKLGLADCVVVSFGKSGRTWLRVMLSRYYQLRHDLADHHLIGFDNLHRKDPAIPRIFFTHDNYLAHYTGNVGSKRDFYDTKVVLLVRNPQDVAVSQFFQWKFRMREHKKVLNHYPSDPDTSIFDFVMDEKAGIPRICDFLNLWADELPHMKDLLVIRYEDMRADTEACLARVIELIEGSADPALVKGAVEFASIENMRKLETSSTFRGGRMKPRDKNNPDSFKVRRAKVGGYRDYFEEDEVTRIDALVRERLSTSFAYQGTGDAAS